MSGTQSWHRQQSRIICWRLKLRFGILRRQSEQNSRGKNREITRWHWVEDSVPGLVSGSILLDLFFEDVVPEACFAGVIDFKFDYWGIHALLIFFFFLLSRHTYHTKENDRFKYTNWILATHISYRYVCLMNQISCLRNMIPRINGCVLPTIKSYVTITNTSEHTSHLRSLPIFELIYIASICVFVLYDSVGYFGRSVGYTRESGSVCVGKRGAHQGIRPNLTLSKGW